MHKILNIPFQTNKISLSTCNQKLEYLMFSPKNLSSQSGNNQQSENKTENIMYMIKSTLIKQNKI